MPRVSGFDAFTDCSSGTFWPMGLSPTIPDPIADTDGDSINDGDEVNGANGFVTDPTLADTDAGGGDDGQEITEAREDIQVSEREEGPLMPASPSAAS